MKIEKLNTDKIRVTFSTEDLNDNNIDFHSFMSNTEKSQSLFLYILDLANEQIGFSTDDYRVKVETMYLNNGLFILNITRFKENLITQNPRVKVSTKKFNFNIDSTYYIFSNIDDFLDFYSILKNTFDIRVLEDCKYSLYFYKNNYYLIMNYSCLNTKYSETFLNLLSEYSSSVFLDEKNSFGLKLKEFGKCLKNNCTF